VTFQAVSVHAVYGLGMRQAMTLVTVGGGGMQPLVTSDTVDPAMIGIGLGERIGSPSWQRVQPVIVSLPSGGCSGWQSRQPTSVACLPPSAATLLI